MIRQHNEGMECTAVVGRRMGSSDGRGEIVARLMLDSPLPKGAVVHLPMVGGGGRDLNYILKAGIWRVVGDPEIAVLAGYRTSLTKMLVEEIGSIIPPAHDDQDANRWLTAFEYENPPVRDDVP